MKIVIKKSFTDRLSNRLSKKSRIRKKVNGTHDRPRLCIYRSLNHIYVQVIDDSSMITVLEASSLDIKEKISLAKKAEEVGKIIAEKAIKKSISNVVFDRNGFLYHGRVKAFAESARKHGLNF